jgi:beta-lactamase regulating signal transducer with metallopeptidase domain
VEQGTYIEKRIVSAQIAVFVLRDLLPGVTYFIRITPVAVTGELLQDLAAEAQGTPASTGPGFHASPSEPAPALPALESKPITPPLHSGAPKVGLPSSTLWIIGSVVGAAVLFLWQQQRKRRQTLQFMRMMQNYYQR